MPEGLPLQLPVHAWPLPWKLALGGAWGLGLLAIGIAMFEIQRSWRWLVGRPPPASEGFLDAPVSTPLSLRGVSWLGAACVFAAAWVWLFVLPGRAPGGVALLAMFGSMAAFWAAALLARARGRARLSRVLEGATIVPVVVAVVHARGAWDGQLARFAWLLAIAAGIGLPVWLGLAWTRYVPQPGSPATAATRIVAGGALVTAIGWAIWWGVGHLH